MSIKKYLTIIAICTACCWGAWFSVLFFINPVSMRLVGVISFYFSFLFSLIGSFSLLGYYVRSYIKKDSLLFRNLNEASRQALILAVLIIIALIMQSFNFLFWWNLLLLVFIGILVEMFFMSFRRV